MDSSAQATALITLENVNARVNKLREYVTYARGAVRTKARKSKQSWAVIRVLPCPKVDTMELRFDPAVVMNQVIHELMKDGYVVAPIGRGQLLVDWTSQFQQAEQAHVEQVPDRMAALDLSQQQQQAALRANLAELNRRRQLRTASASNTASVGGGGGGSVRLLRY